MNVCVCVTQRGLLGLNNGKQPMPKKSPVLRLDVPIGETVKHESVVEFPIPFSFPLISHQSFPYAWPWRSFAELGMA